jgi:hypothetical protein
MVNTFTDVMAAMLASITNSSFTEDFSGDLDDWTLISGTTPAIVSGEMKFTAVGTIGIELGFQNPTTVQFDIRTTNVTDSSSCILKNNTSGTNIVTIRITQGKFMLYGASSGAFTSTASASIDTDYTLVATIDYDAGTIALTANGVAVVAASDFSDDLAKGPIDYITFWDTLVEEGDILYIDDISVTKTVEHAIIQDNEKPKRHTRETYIHVKPAPGTPDLAFDGTYITEDLQGVVEVFAKNDTTRNAIVDDVRTALAAGDYPFMILREGYMDARNYHLYTFNIKLTV